MAFGAGAKLSDGSTILDEGNIAKYNDKIYSIKYVNKSLGFFLIPVEKIKSGSDPTSIGFWAPITSCKLLPN